MFLYSNFLIPYFQFSFSNFHNYSRSFSLFNQYLILNLSTRKFVYINYTLINIIIRNIHFLSYSYYLAISFIFLEDQLPISTR